MDDKKLVIKKNNTSSGDKKHFAELEISYVRANMCKFFCKRLIHEWP